MNMPWHGTTQEIASQDDPRYETPGGAQNKVDTALNNFKNEVELPIRNESIVERHYRIDSVSSRALAQKAVQRRHLETGVIGWAELDPVLLNDIDDVIINANFERVDEQLAEKVKFHNTVSDMLADSKLLVGDIVRTLGYYSAGDGGTNLYMVISSSAKSYDLIGVGVALRPASTGVINPKMFGTINDSVSLDNLTLQRCFDYAEDYGIEQIDGLDLLYTIGTVNKYDFRHYGVLMQSGRRFSNARFITASGSSNFTTPLAIEMNDKAVYLENLTIDGNRLNLSVDDNDPAEDGGCHAIYLKPPVGIPDEFTPCGNIYLKDITIKDVYSYGITSDPLECSTRIDGLKFNGYGIAVIIGATDFEATNCDITIGNPRPGKIFDAFQTELEFSANYTGSKKQSVVIKKTKFNAASSNPTFQYLYKINYEPMGGAVFERIIIDECEVLNNGVFFSAYNNHTGKVLVINNLEITKPNTSAAYAVADIAATTNNFVKILNMKVSSRGPRGNVILIKTNVVKLICESVEFTDAGKFTLDTCVFDDFIIRNSKVTSLSGYGVLRNEDTSIKLLHIYDSEIVENAYYIFRAKISSIMAGNITFKPNSSNQHNILFSCVGIAKLEANIKDSVLTGSSYEFGGCIVETDATDGYVYLSNVRPVTILNFPVISAGSLPGEQKILLNCEKLY